MAKIQFYWHSAKKEKEEKKVRKMLCSWNQRVAWVGLLVIVVILVALKYAFFLIWSDLFFLILTIPATDTTMMVKKLTIK